jgi:hypothetical protein
LLLSADKFFYSYRRWWRWHLGKVPTLERESLLTVRYGSFFPAALERRRSARAAARFDLPPLMFKLWITTPTQVPHGDNDGVDFPGRIAQRYPRES